jgi:hypothetical protein
MESQKRFAVSCLLESAGREDFILQLQETPGRGWRSRIPHP